MTSLLEQVVEIGDALERSGVPWAFGGGVALAYATNEPRGTRRIDVNVFVPADHAATVFEALPAPVGFSVIDVTAAWNDDRVRLFWEDTPVDVFFAADPFHAEVADRTRSVPFAGRTIRVLCPEDLTVFTAMFDRPEDWVDIAAMVEANSVDLGVASRRLEQLLPGDSRIERLRSLGG